jgi:hypothetical protein
MCLYSLINAALCSCELPPKQQMQVSFNHCQTGADTVSANEEYVMVTTAVNMPCMCIMMKPHFALGTKMGVRTSILGPQIGM